MPLPSRAAAATAAAPPQTRAPKCARRRAASGGEVSCLAVHARRSGGGGCRSRAVSGLLRCMRAVRSSRDGSRAPSPQPRLHSKGRRAPSRDRGCRARGRGSRSVESALRGWRARGDTCSESPPPQTHAPSTRAVAARRAAAPSAFRVDEQMRRNRRDLPSISVMPSFACRTLWISAVPWTEPSRGAAGCSSPTSVVGSSGSDSNLPRASELSDAAAESPMRGSVELPRRRRSLSWRLCTKGRRWDLRAIGRRSNGSGSARALCYTSSNAQHPRRQKRPTGVLVVPLLPKLTMLLPPPPPLTARRGARSMGSRVALRPLR